MSNIRRQLEELRSEAYRLANSIEGLRQAHELAMPGTVRDALRLAVFNCEVSARLLNRARVELKDRARVMASIQIDDINDVGTAMEQDAQAFPVCVQCRRDIYECACDAPEAA